MVTLFRKELRVWFLVTVAASSLPFFLFAAYALSELGKSEREGVSIQLLQGAQSTANAVNQRLAVSVGYLTALASSDAAQHNDIPALYAHAQRIMQLLPEANAVSLVSQDNSIVFLTLRPLGTKGLVTNEPDTVQRVFTTGKPAVSGPFKAPISDKIVTSVGIPVMQDGRVAYCLRIVLLTSSLSELLAAQMLPDDWTIAIIAGNGKLVARSRAPEIFVGKLASAEILAGIRTGKQEIFDTKNLEGDLVKAVIVKLPQWDWTIAMGVPVDSLNVSRNRAYRLLAMFGLAVAVLGALASYGLPRLAVLKNGGAPQVASPVLQISGVWPGVIALAVAMVLSVTAALSTQSALSQMQQRAYQRLAATTQKAQIIELLSLFKDLETGQRGFVITGQEAFLEPYHVAVTRIPQLISSLKAGLTQGRLEGFNWAEFDALSITRQALAAQAIAERRSQGERVLNDTALFDHGRLAMDKIRLQLQSLEGMLTTRVDKLTEQLQREVVQTSQAQWLVALAAGTLVCFSVGFWLLERQRRKQLFAELAVSHERLESRVAERTAQLQRAGERIRNFSAESERNIESERKRLSREVHDQIGQVFTGIKMILKTLKPGSLAAEQQEALATAIDMGVKTTRRIAAELRPPLLDDLGLRAALDFYLRTNVGVVGLGYDLEIPQDHGLSGEQMTQMFRIVQEATTNILRHAQASHISVTGVVASDAWRLTIDDDGVGFDATQVREGALGLLGIQERAQMLGGHANVEGRPEGGTRVVVHIPGFSAPEKSQKTRQETL